MASKTRDNFEYCPCWQLLQKHTGCANCLSKYRCSMQGAGCWVQVLKTRG